MRIFHKLLGLKSIASGINAHAKGRGSMLEKIKQEETL